MPHSTLPTPPADIDRVIHIFESLTAHSVAELGTIYAPDALFVDAVKQVFSHMFASLEHPHFVVTGKVVQADQCFLLWEFRFRFRSFRRQVDQVVPGTSHLRFDAQGRITHHHDYWDAAHGIYEKIPLIGGLVRWLRIRVNS
jgi:hypothetical protein